MIEGLPLYISLVFMLTTFVAVWMFYKAAYNSSVVMYLLVLWLGVQGILAYVGVYLEIDNSPPPILFALAIPVLSMIIVLSTAQGRRFTNFMDGTILTYLHLVRIPVEIIMLWLYHHGQIPQSMTFKGLNFDILSGLTAPVIAFFGMSKRLISNRYLVIWNVIALALFVNIVVHGVLASPSVFQKFAFHQPNVAILYFPFIWLPSCIIPLVIFSHVAVLKRLAMEKI